MLSVNSRLCAAAVMLTLLTAAASGWLDQRGFDYTQDGMQRALVTFGVSRTLNGVISVAQGTEVAVEPVGIGMTFTPGQILDPINDLIERFSTVVLVAGTAFGAQHVMLEFTASSLFGRLLFILVVLSLVSFVFWAKMSHSVRSTVLRLTCILLFTRLAVPGFAISGEMFYRHFLAPQYEQSSDELGSAAAQLNVLYQEQDQQYDNQLEERSFLDSARDWVKGAGSSMDFKARLAEFAETAERISEHAIRLMVVFVFQTLVLPILAIWLTLKGIRTCWQFAPRTIPQEIANTPDRAPTKISP